MRSSCLVRYSLMSIQVYSSEKNPYVYFKKTNSIAFAENKTNL